MHLFLKDKGLRTKVNRDLLIDIAIIFEKECTKKFRLLESYPLLLACHGKELLSMIREKNRRQGIRFQQYAPSNVDPFSPDFKEDALVIQTRDGDALHSAVSSGRIESVAMLLAAGFISSNDRKAAILISMALGFHQITYLLLAEINIDRLYIYTLLTHDEKILPINNLIEAFKTLLQFITPMEKADKEWLIENLKYNEEFLVEFLKLAKENFSPSLYDEFYQFIQLRKITYPL